MKNCAHRLLLFLSILFTDANSKGAGFTEPTLVLYGRVLQSASGSPNLLQSGELSITFTNEENPANSLTRTVALQPVGEGNIKLYSYAMVVPLKYNVQAYEMNQFIEVKGNGAQFSLSNVLVDGQAAELLSPGDEIISISQTDRADERRVDIGLSAPSPDSDGDGIPDWWEELHGLNPYFDGDGGLDNDGDGLTNLEEFEKGTNPNDTGDGNRVPSLLTTQLIVTSGGTSGLALQVVDSDTPPDSIDVLAFQGLPGLSFLVGGFPFGNFKASDLADGNVTMTHDGTSPGGTITFLLVDGDHPPVQYEVEVIVFNPESDGLKPHLWLDAEELALNPGDPVSIWTDKAGNLEANLSPRALVQDQSPIQPVYQEPGGLAAVVFDGAGSYLASADDALPSTTRGLFVFYRVDTAAVTSQTFLKSNSLDYEVSPFDGPVGYPGAASLRVTDRRIDGFRTSLNSAFLASYRLTDEDGYAVSAGLHNGSTEPDTSTPSPVIPAMGSCVEFDLSNPSQFLVEESFEGDVHEVLLYDRLLDESFACLVEMYLLSRWDDVTIWNYAEELAELKLTGSDGRDLLKGGYAADTINGGGAADLIYGGPSDDLLSGGDGPDIFCYREMDTGNDCLLDFTATGTDHDIIDLSGRFRGKKGSVFNFLSLEPRVEIVGSSIVLTTLIHLDLDGDGGVPDQSLTLKGIALSNADLGWLLGEGIIVAGDLNIDAVVSLGALAVNLVEGGGPIDMTVSRTGNTATALEIPLHPGGTATYLVDYTLGAVGGSTARPTVEFARNEASKTFQLIPVVDPLDEPTETVVLEIIEKDRDYSIDMGECEFFLEPATQVTLATTNNILARQGGQSGTLTVTRTGSVQLPLTVFLAVDGDAAPGVDYVSLPGSITIPAGSPSAVVPITPIDSTDTSAVELHIEAAQSPGQYITVAPWTASFLIVAGSSTNGIGFDEWRSENDPGSAGIPLDEYAALDGDNNGVTNLEEYLNGTNPILAEPGDTGLFALEFTPGPGTTEFEVRQGRQRYDVLVDIESTSNLEQWTSIGDDISLTASVVNPDLSWVRTYEQQNSGQRPPRSFYRLAARLLDLAGLLSGAPSLLSADGTGYPLVTAGDAAWQADQTEGEGFMIDGLDPGQSSVLAMAITGPGVLRFEWRVDGESMDTLGLTLDGAEVDSLQGGTSAWSTVELNLNEGEHIVSWTYSESGTSGGAGRARRVELVNP